MWITWNHKEENCENHINIDNRFLNYSPDQIGIKKMLLSVNLILLSYKQIIIFVILSLNNNSKVVTNVYSLYNRQNI